MPVTKLEGLLPGRISEYRRRLRDPSNRDSDSEISRALACIGPQKKFAL
jgi:hypothetical protein